jgi:hypothetical protein
MDFKFCDTDYIFTINDHWQIVSKKPNDSEELSVIGMNHQNCYTIVFCNPITEKEIMPIWDKTVTINSVRHYLEKNQGIIEINNNLDKFPYIYTIVKFQREPHGVNYLFRFHIKLYSKYYQIDGMFDEMGTTGTRDSTIFEKCRRDGVVQIEEVNGKMNLIGWNEDPYDKNIKNGFLMNLSEKEEFDEYFPYHPLSEIRNLLKNLIDNFNKIYDSKK